MTSTGTSLVYRDALTICIGHLVRWYQPIVFYTVGKYKFLFLLPKIISFVVTRLFLVFI